jgi:hypothetical protein
MRTKAEALAKPMAGDRWTNKKGVERYVTKIEDERIVFFNTDSSVYADRFRRWAANAEYLGGAE